MRELVVKQVGGAANSQALQGHGDSHTEFDVLHSC